MFKLTKNDAGSDVAVVEELDVTSPAYLLFSQLWQLFTVVASMPWCTKIGPETW